MSSGGSHDETLSAPKRFIYNDHDMEKFMESPVKKELLRFIGACGKSCASKIAYCYDPSNPIQGLSPAMASLVGALEGMLNWMLDIPPAPLGTGRFGNPSFRTWHERLVQRSDSIVQCILQTGKEYPGPDDVSESVLEKARQNGFDSAGNETDTSALSSHEEQLVQIELSAYLQASFGHPIRLDYGTGHESSFQVFLFCLCKLGYFGSSPENPPSIERLKAVTLSVWNAYLAVTRQLQTDYMLEPAGSHGVWGLDDYHCLPFYYGACQLHNFSDEYTPESIHDDTLLEQKGDAFLYFGCIRYIKSLKKGVPFFEHSPMLNDISQLPTWHKVASGLLRLYEGEVLNKRQVVQHFVFKNIFAASWSASDQSRDLPDEGFRSDGTGPVGPMARAPWANEPKTK